MPRQLRTEGSDAFYHVMNRADRREPIFGDDADRNRFLETLGEGCAKTEWRLHAYRLMGNHFHLALATPRHNIRCRGAPTNTNNMGMHRKLAGPELFQGASRMGRGRRPRVLSVARPVTGTSRPRPCALTFLSAPWELFRGVFKNGSRRREEADLGAKNTFASLPRRFCRLTRLSVLENSNRNLWPGFNARSSQFS